MLSTRTFVWRFRNSVLPCLGVFALGLAAAAPAGAVVRTAQFSWTPATGPVAGYRIYLSIDREPEEVYGAVNGPSATILVESGAELVVRVAAFDFTGREGPASAPSPPLRLCPGDFDADEIIGQEDVSQALGCFQKPATGTCAGAEMVDDGYITNADISALELGADACAGFPSLGCPGDLDRNGIISALDLSLLRNCIGLAAQGSCIDGDLDGNGYVTASDWVQTGRSLGMACTN
jgi:hypothetical protein